MHSNTALRVGRYITAAVVGITLVDILAASVAEVVPAIRAVGARVGSKDVVSAGSLELHTADTI